MDLRTGHCSSKQLQDKFRTHTSSEPCRLTLSFDCVLKSAVREGSASDQNAKKRLWIKRLVCSERAINQQISCKISHDPSSQTGHSGVSL